jgi:hypothetical protein
MADKKQLLSKNKVRRKTGGKTTSGKRKQTSREKTTNTDGMDGAERLRQAADKQVGQNSEKLAGLLADKALKGDLASTRVLVGLAERKKPHAKPATKRHGPSLAEQLSAEPKWQEEEEEQRTANSDRFLTA